MKMKKSFGKRGGLQNFKKAIPGGRIVFGSGNAVKNKAD
jgi:hypothetical protein